MSDLSGFTSLFIYGTFFGGLRNQIKSNVEVGYDDKMIIKVSSSMHVHWSVYLEAEYIQDTGTRFVDS